MRAPDFTAAARHRAPALASVALGLLACGPGTIAPSHGSPGSVAAETALPPPEASVRAGEPAPQDTEELSVPDALLEGFEGRYPRRLLLAYEGELRASRTESPAPRGPRVAWGPPELVVVEALDDDLRVVVETRAFRVLGWLAKDLAHRVVHERAPLEHAPRRSPPAAAGVWLEPGFVAPEGAATSAGMVEVVLERPVVARGWVATALTGLTFVPTDPRAPEKSWGGAVLAGESLLAAPRGHPVARFRADAEADVWVVGQPRHGFVEVLLQEARVEARGWVRASSVLLRGSMFGGLIAPEAGEAHGGPFVLRAGACLRAAPQGALIGVARRPAQVSAVRGYGDAPQGWLRMRLVDVHLHQHVWFSEGDTLPGLPASRDAPAHFGAATLSCPR